MFCMYQFLLLLVLFLNRFLNSLYCSMRKEVGQNWYKAIGLTILFEYRNRSWVRIFKLLRSPGIYSKESIPPAHVAGRGGTTTYSYSVPSPHRLFKILVLGSLNLRALAASAGEWRNRFLGIYSWALKGLKIPSLEMCLCGWVSGGWRTAGIALEIPLQYCSINRWLFQTLFVWCMVTPWICLISYTTPHSPSPHTQSHPLCC